MDKIIKELSNSCFYYRTMWKELNDYCYYKAEILGEDSAYNDILKQMEKLHSIYKKENFKIMSAKEAHNIIEKSNKEKVEQ
jgi:hypothetical protein